MTNASTSSSARRCSRSAPARATSRPISPTSPTRSGRSRSSSRWPSARAASTTRLIARGYTEYKRDHHQGNADGYYGWEEAAPFDKIIVTCGIDHVPPPLLQQLKAGGIMVIPVGPPGAQRVLKVIKEQARRRHDHGRPRRTSTAAGSCPSCRSPSSTATRSRARTTSGETAPRQGTSGRIGSALPHRGCGVAGACRAGRAGGLRHDGAPRPHLQRQAHDAERRRADRGRHRASAVALPVPVGRPRRRRGDRAADRHHAHLLGRQLGAFRLAGGEPRHARLRPDQRRHVRAQGLVRAALAAAWR